MKLSKIKGERVFDVIADIIDPIANIAEDKEAAALFQRQKLPDGVNAKDFVLARVKKSAPLLLRGHKKDLIAILAAVEGVPAKKYAAGLTLAKLLVDVTELMTDEAFTDLFTSAQTETAETPSGSVQENIGEAKE